MTARLDQIMFRWLDTNRSKLSLRLAYQMPANLDLYVGPAGVWGDVNDILQSSLYVMKARLDLSAAQWKCKLAEIVIEMTLFARSDTPQAFSYLYGQRKTFY